MNKKFRKSCCFVEGCKSGIPATRKMNKIKRIKNPSMFRVPHDEVLLHKWNKAISRPDKQLASYDVVCENHFFEKDIERFYITKLANGDIFKLERSYPILKPSAIPHKKSNSLLNQKVKKIEKPKREVYPVVVVVEMNETETTVDRKLKNNAFFEKLKTDLNNVILPTMKWTSVYRVHCDDFVFGEWNDSCQFQKQLVLHSDLSVNVFLGDIEIHDKSVLPGHINDMNDITEALKLIQNLTPCKGLENLRIRDDCLGFASERKLNGKPNNKCTNCVKKHVIRINSH